DDPTVGASKVARKLRATFRELGHECDALFRADLGGPKAERLRLVLAPGLAARAIARAWRANGPYDVIDAAAASGWVAALARRLGRFPGAAVVARSHGLEHIYYRELLADHRAGLLHKPWWRRFLFPLARLPQVALNFRHADRALMLNPHGVAWALEHGWQEADNIDLIRHGVDAHRWASAPAPDAPRGAGVLFSAAWHTAKGTAYLAEALRLLVRRGTP